MKHRGGAGIDDLTIEKFDQDIVYINAIDKTKVCNLITQNITVIKQI